MKKFLSLIILSLVGIANMPTSFAYSSDYSYREYWEITSFHTDATINKDGSVSFTETINVDFTNEAHRGIERSIPISYENGYQSQIDFISANNENGEEWNNYVFKDGNYLRIQMTIADDIPFAAPATFIITYTANNVVSFFDEHTELYWNVTGDEWVVPINQASISINLPEDIPQEELSFDCYTGGYKSTLRSCEWETKNNQAQFYSTSSFDPYEGLTIALGMPTGYIEEPTLTEVAHNIFRMIQGLLLIPATLFTMILLWMKKGRDAKNVKDTIMPHYSHPENLSPTEVGTIIDEKMDPKDLTATIIDFAVKGYIKIKEIEGQKFLFFDSTDYELELLSRPKEMKEYEKQILDGIFYRGKNKAKISSLANKFYKTIPKVRKAIFKSLIANNYFPHNPRTIRNIYLIAGSIIAWFGFQITTAFSLDWGIGIVVSGLIIIAFHRIMPRKTKKGTEVYYQLKGLYEYINTAEKDRLKFQEEAGLMFEKLLPYAMAFGIADKWARAFEGMLTEPPNWYHSPSLNNFNMTAFADSIDSFNSNTVSNLSSAPSSSGGSGLGGGGFSGGGFGGGGGRGL